MPRSIKILLPWLERNDAIMALLGFRQQEPNENVGELVARYEAQKATVASRPSYQIPLDNLKPLPEEIASRGAALITELAPRFGTNPKLVRACLVDLRHVIAIQRGVTLDEIAERVAGIEREDWPRLAELCLAGAEANAEDFKGTVDKDGKGVSFSSLSPNLRAGALHTISQSGGTLLVGIPIIHATRHLHVTEYQGRLFLRDGYHRAYGLLARGVYEAPCLVETVGSFHNVHADTSNFISTEHLLGAHPPLLPDFLDDAVSYPATREYYRKIIRIRAEEFYVSE